jgi:hypothetical protein
MLRAVFGDSPPPHGEPGYVTVSVEARDGEFEVLTTSQKAVRIGSRTNSKKSSVDASCITGPTTAHSSVLEDGDAKRCRRRERVRELIDALDRHLASVV